MKGYRKVLIAVNGSYSPLRAGLQLASDEKTWVTVVKVLPPYEGDLELTGIKDLEDVLSSGRDEVTGAIRSVVGEERGLAKVRVEEGDISETISKVAEEENCDLIIMGRKKSKGWLGRLLGDNVTAKVVNESSRPVLFV